MLNWKTLLPAAVLLAFGVAQGFSQMAIELTLYAGFYLAGLYKKEYALYLFALSYPFLTFRPIIFFLLVLIFLLLMEGIDKERLMNVVKSKVFLAAAFFVLAVGITAVTSVNLRESMQDYVLYYLPSLVLLAVLMMFIDSRTVLYRFLLCFVVSGAVLALYGLAQYLLIGHTPPKWVDVKTNPLLGTRIYAVFGNPNVFAEYLVLVLPLCFALIYYVKAFKHKILLCGLFAVTALALVLTYSRGAWVAFAFAMLLLLLKTDRKLILYGLILVLVAAAFNLIPQVIMDRLATIVNPTEDTSGDYRFKMWTAAFAIIRDYWLTGIGSDPSTLFRVYADYEIPGVNIFHLHNIWIQAFVNGGILGIAALLYLFYRLLKESYTISANRLGGRQATLGIALFASITGIGVAGLNEDIWHDYRVMMAFWIVTALIGSIEMMLRLGRNKDGTV
ncbi:O-antigen ligase family protein [Brevibacillus massiliensis]|jgi:O-antigen ligase|uniref:O-antigen ligase family protein n=1 Tax=Brevibacillus massiliensis TaxID=1118054 RepID=UPI0003031EFF|nr:O-antigen ligase family protein [Brevibacillus massiliensis]